jgi:hypothetical protein
VNYLNDATSRVHQLYVVGNLMFVGYYTSGFKVFDITNPRFTGARGQLRHLSYQSETDADVYHRRVECVSLCAFGHRVCVGSSDGVVPVLGGGFTGTITGAVIAGWSVHALSESSQPVQSSTTISFQMNRRAATRLSVYDVNGQRVATLVDRDLPAGAHQVAWERHRRTRRARRLGRLLLPPGRRRTDGHQADGASQVSMAAVILRPYD